MVWARSQRCTVSPTRHEVDLAAIPILTAGSWRLVGTPEITLTGAAPKHYLAYGDYNSPDCEAYIAKKGARKGGVVRDCVTEELISKIGRALPVRMADSRLVRLPVPYGDPPDVRFMSRNFVRRGEELLIHGAEVVALYLGTKPDEVHRVFDLDNPQAEHRFYTVRHMFEVLTWFCQKDEQERSSVLDGFARMLAFDALVGAPDRHATNWGLLVPLAPSTKRKEFAPLFDTARGMFREYSDEDLRAIDRRDGGRPEFIKNYARKSRPVLGIGEVGPERCNHFDLVQHTLNEVPELGRSIAKFVRGSRMPDVAKIVRRRFGRVISPTRVSFVLDLLQHRYNRLRMLVEGTSK